ncbi:DUF3616 domain-containing protein [Methylobacterium oryzae]|uniref:Protein of unassigned function n=1 Tax=Methylobacterium oryzae CBMB20 TaxID=693986 RepID=A0A089P562_9HYPH|nr:DUF3616 domain-containing protein [Methylobacterium oryzae]AIQ93198.1 protein of unassigned function [Methylobacterium oryzae CBMB20]
MRVVVAAVLGVVCLVPLRSALAQSTPALLKPGATLGTVEALAGEDENEPEGVSGIACRPATGLGRTCLLINDESQAAQVVQIKDGVIIPGETIPIVGDAPSTETLGRAPRVTSCPKKDAGGFDESDGEGVAFSDPYFYVVGSHGCSRKKGKFKLSSFLVARIRMDAQDVPDGKKYSLETSYRLSDYLQRAPRVGRFFGTQLQNSEASDDDANGLNVEGIAVRGDTMYVGLRAPVDRDAGEAFLLRVSVSALFDKTSGKEHAPSEAVPDVIPLRLGRNVGIRDLTFMPDDRLLVLGGPAQEQSVPYGLYAVEPSTGAVSASWRIPPLVGALKKGKAEALTMLGPGRVLIMFDALANGGAREYSFE